MAKWLLLVVLAACGGGDDDDMAAPDGGSDTSLPGDASAAEHLQAVVDDTLGAKVIGAGLAVRWGDFTWTGAAGVKAMGGDALAADDLYRVGSVTKTYTAAVVLLLVQAGELALDDTVDAWIPDLPSANMITIRHLLRHESGLANYLDAPGADPGDPQTHAELLAYAKAEDLAFTPGARHEYSNTNYAALGIIIEAVEGKTWAQSVHDRILGPLDLDDTYLDGDDALPGDPAQGYWVRSGMLELPSPATHPSWSWAAGAVVSTLEDQLTFFHALLEGDLLEPATLALMQDDVAVPDTVLTYGLGLYGYATDDHGQLWHHTGVIDGTLSLSGTYVDLDLSVAVYLTTYPGDPYDPVEAAAAVMSP